MVQKCVRLPGKTCLLYCKTSWGYQNCGKKITTHCVGWFCWWGGLIPKLHMGQAAYIKICIFKIREEKHILMRHTKEVKNGTNSNSGIL